MRGAYYNEHEPFAAQWLRNLIAAGHIAPGEVDGRSILDVTADDLKGYSQCHLFAGIGGWSLALRLGGWPDDRPVWTGSCPCQPLSGAGRRKGHADQRHLWPAFHRLIAERRPAAVFGEQLANADGREWLAAVRADLEAVGYAVGAADLCAASVGAPHIRQRVFWVADADHGRRPGAGGARRDQDDGTVECCMPGGLVDPGAAGLPSPECEALEREGRRQEGRATVESGGASDRLLADADGDGCREAGRRLGEAGRDGPLRDGPAGGLGDADGVPGEWVAGGIFGPQAREQPAQRQEDGRGADRPADAGGGVVASFWADAQWIPCRDGKARPIEPGTFPLAHGISNRVGRLRAYGNAIIPQVGAAFVEAFLACRP